MAESEDAKWAKSMFLKIVDPIVSWLDRVDPQAARRVKGLRVVTAYGIAAMMGTLGDIANGVPDHATLAALAGNFALWASISEARSTRADSTRDLLILVLAACLGALSFVVLAQFLQAINHALPELVLVSGAFAVSYLRKFGVTGAGAGSQLFIGQLLGYSTALTVADFTTIAVAGILAAIAAIVPRILSGPSEHPLAPAPVPRSAGRSVSPELVMGFQAAIASAVIVLLNVTFGMTESAWAIVACAYVVAYTAAETTARVKRRIVGTAIGVPIAFALLLLTSYDPLILWPSAALAMIVYSMAMPNRYDIACGAYAFILIVTLAANGERSIWLFASRGWETMLGGAIGLGVALYLLPLSEEASSEHRPKS